MAIDSLMGFHDLKADFCRWGYDSRRVAGFRDAFVPVAGTPLIEIKICPVLPVHHASEQGFLHGAVEE